MAVYLLYSLRTEKTEPNKVGDDVWQVSVIATVRKGKSLIRDAEVKFYLGDQFEATEQTNDDGIASHEFFLTKGAHTIFVRLADGTSGRVVYVLQDKATAQPAKIITSESRVGKKHIVFYQVLTVDNKPVPNLILRVLDKTHDKGYYDLLPTDKSGIAIDQVEFKGREKRFDILVVGSSVSIWKSLYN